MKDFIKTNCSFLVPLIKKLIEEKLMFSGYFKGLDKDNFC